MTNNSLKNLLSGSAWGIAAKILDAIIKFVSIPLLIHHYGKGDFGLVSLALTLNAYLRLMDVGLNVGGIRYFSIWFAKGDTESIIKVSRSGVLVYGIIGAVNAVVFLVIAFMGESWFHLTTEQAPLFRSMMIFLACSTIISWVGYVVEQLLNSIEEFSWINKMTLLSSVGVLVATLMATFGGFSISTYYLLYLLATVMIIPLNIWRLKKTDLSVPQLLVPQWHGQAFKQVVKYGLGIFAMGIFQISADSLRPIMLGLNGANGVERVADFRIIQTICVFVMSVGGIFFSMLIPVSSKAYSENNEAKISSIVYQGTRLITAFLVLLTFGLAINARQLLLIYVGTEYLYLTPWLILALVSLLINMHTFAISSVIVSSGKTRPLVISSMIGCAGSLILSYTLAPILQVGAAVLGFFFFVLVNGIFSYAWYIPRILKIDAVKVFLQFVLPVLLIGSFAWLLTDGILLLVTTHNPYIQIVVRSVAFAGLYLVFLTVICFGVRNPFHFRRDIKQNLLREFQL